MKFLSLIALLMFQMLATSVGSAAPPAAGVLTEPVAATVRFTGPINSAGPMRWVVAGRPVIVDSHTKIVASDGVPAPGMAANVIAQWQPGEELHATVLEARQAPFPLSGGARFVSGFIDQILTDRWVINGESIVIERGTLVVGEPVVGAFAVARIVAEPAARVIVVAPAGELPSFLGGEISALLSGGWLVQISGDAWFVQVPASAYVEGQPVVGAHVDLMVLEGQNGTPRALYASVSEPLAGATYLSGRLLAKIVGTQPEQWLLLRDGEGESLVSETIVVDRQTVLIDEGYGPAQEGAWLELSATPSPTGNWIAQHILVAAGPLDFIEGEIESVGALSGGIVRVAGQDVIVDAGSQLDGRPRVGRYALVYGSRHASSTLWAAHFDVRYRFSGTLIDRIFHDQVETWVILTQSADSTIDTSPQARVYLLVDHSTQVSPELLNASAGVAVAVQARAAVGGWVGDWIEAVQN